MTDPISQAAGRSLHQRIIGDLESRILSGGWPPGTRIPFEMELASDYGCSRMTVNKALTQLAKTGLIERRRKSGSFVAQPRSQSAVLEIRDIRQEVLALGLPYAYSLEGRRRRKATLADRRSLDLPAGAFVLDVTCRHFAGKRPFCLEERLINLAVVPAAGDEPFAEIAPGPWLLERVPWSAADHTIRAVAADAEMAAALDIAIGSACLAVERRTASNGAFVTFVRLTYPGDRHALTASFAPSQQG